MKVPYSMLAMKPVIFEVIAIAHNLASRFTQCFTHSQVLLEHTVFLVSSSLLLAVVASSPSIDALVTCTTLFNELNTDPFTISSGSLRVSTTLEHTQQRLQQTNYVSSDFECISLFPQNSRAVTAQSSLLPASRSFYAPARMISCIRNVK